MKRWTCSALDLAREHVQHAVGSGVAAAEEERRRAPHRVPGVRHAGQGALPPQERLQDAAVHQQPAVGGERRAAAELAVLHARRHIDSRSSTEPPGSLLPPLLLSVPFEATVQLVQQRAQVLRGHVYGVRDEEKPLRRRRRGGRSRRGGRKKRRLRSSSSSSSSSSSFFFLISRRRRRRRRRHPQEPLEHRPRARDAGLEEHGPEEHAEGVAHAALELAAPLVAVPDGAEDGHNHVVGDCHHGRGQLLGRVRAHGGLEGAGLLRRVEDVVDPGHEGPRDVVQDAGPRDEPAGEVGPAVDHLPRPIDGLVVDGALAVEAVGVGHVQAEGPREVAEHEVVHVEEALAARRRLRGESLHEARQERPQLRDEGAARGDPRAPVHPEALVPVLRYVGDLGDAPGPRRVKGGEDAREVPQVHVRVVAHDHVPLLLRVLVVHAREAHEPLVQGALEVILRRPRA